MKLPGTLLLLAISAVVAAGPTQAFAQTDAPQRPSNGLFFEERTASQIRQRFDVTMSSTEGYDSNTDSLAQRAVVEENGLEPAGPSTMLSAAAVYSWRGQRAQVRATGTSTLRYYRGLGDFLHSSSTSSSHVAAMGFSIGSRQTTLVANQTASHASSALPNLLPGSDSITAGEAPPPALDYAASDFEINSYTTGFTLARTLGRRNSIEATAEYQRSETRSASTAWHNVNVYASRLQYRRPVAPATGVTAAYLYRIGNIGFNIAAQPGRMLPEHGIEFGVHHRRALGASRHVTFLARVGASTLKLADAVDASGQSPLRHNQLSAQLSTSYEFGRSWQLRGTVRRGGVEYIAGLSEPVSGNSVTTSIDGLLSRRTDVLVSAAYWTGGFALTHGGRIVSHTGNARLRYAITHAWAVYVQYVYYFYDFDQNVPLVPGVPPRLERNGVRAGFTLRAPAVRR